MRERLAASARSLRGRLPQPGPAPAAARVGRLDRRPLVVPRGAGGVRLRRGRRGGGRARRRHPDAAGGDRIAVHGHARRPVPAQARDDRVRPRAGAADGGRSPDDPPRRPRRPGLPDRRALDARRSRLPPRAGGAAAVAGARTRPSSPRPTSPRARSRASAASSGPALGGLLLAVSSPEVVFAVERRSRSSGRRRSCSGCAQPSAAGRPTEESPGARTGFVSEAAAGIRAIGRRRATRARSWASTARRRSSRAR